MAPKSKLRMAIAAEKGVDYQKLKEKKKAKATIKRKQEAADQAAEDDSEHEYEEISIEEAGSVEEGSEDESDDEETSFGVNLDAVDESDSSDSSIDFEERLPKKQAKASKANGKGDADDDEDEDEEEEEEEDEEDIPVSDLEDLAEEDKEDLIPHTRLTINNTSALLASLKRISLPTPTFASHQSVVSTAPTSESIPDISDDLQRELAFYSQCLDAVRIGRTKLRSENVPFSRPKDYFAEMVKEDAHMEKVRAKLLEEASNKKAAQEARKQRDLKKYGKQVQVAKLQERQKEKRETLDKIKNLKRKRQDGGGADIGTNEADMFDVGVEKELQKGGAPNSRSGAGRGNGGANNKRQAKDKKYGFGGKKKHSKSGDAMSSGDLSGFDAKRMKAGGGRVGKPQRPGKNRRKNLSTR